MNRYGLVLLFGLAIAALTGCGVDPCALGGDTPSCQTNRVANSATQTAITGDVAARQRADMLHATSDAVAAQSQATQAAIVVAATQQAIQAQATAGAKALQATISTLDLQTTKSAVDQDTDLRRAQVRNDTASGTELLGVIAVPAVLLALVGMVLYYGRATARTAVHRRRVAGSLVQDAVTGALSVVTPGEGDQLQVLMLDNLIGPGGSTNPKSVNDALSLLPGLDDRFRAAAYIEQARRNAFVRLNAVGAQIAPEFVEESVPPTVATGGPQSGIDGLYQIVAATQTPLALLRDPAALAILDAEWSRIGQRPPSEAGGL